MLHCLVSEGNKSEAGSESFGQARGDGAKRETQIIDAMTSLD